MWISFPQTGQWSINHVASVEKGKGSEKRYEENDKTSSGCPTQTHQKKKTKERRWKVAFSLRKVTLPDDVV
jgi:hypothetical protein